jgi:hypothetical protein
MHCCCHPQGLESHITRDQQWLGGCSSLEHLSKGECTWEWMGVGWCGWVWVGVDHPHQTGGLSASTTVLAQSPGSAVTAALDLAVSSTTAVHQRPACRCVQLQRYICCTDNDPGAPWPVQT